MVSTRYGRRFVSKIIGFNRRPGELLGSSRYGIGTHSTGKSADSLPSALGLWSLGDLIAWIHQERGPLPNCTIRSRLGGSDWNLYFSDPFLPD